MCPNGQLPVCLAAGVHSAYLFGLLRLHFRMMSAEVYSVDPEQMQGLLSSSNTLLAKAGKFILTYLGNGLLFFFFSIAKIEPRHRVPFPLKPP